MNEQLAEVVAGLLATRPVRTFAQWEISDTLAAMDVQGDITSIAILESQAGRKCETEFAYASVAL